jgi:hypothetical protein
MCKVLGSIPSTEKKKEKKKIGSEFLLKLNEGLNDSHNNERGSLIVILQMGKRRTRTRTQDSQSGPPKVRQLATGPRLKLPSDSCVPSALSTLQADSSLPQLQPRSSQKPGRLTCMQSVGTMSWRSSTPRSPHASSL